MPKESIYTAIDVGTTKVCTLIARDDGDRGVELLGMGLHPSRGLRKGTVLNVSEARESIRASVAEAQRSAGVKITPAFVGITGADVASANTSSLLTLKKRPTPITSKNVTRAILATQPQDMPEDREMLHLIPRSYVVDGAREVRSPLGIEGQELEVETHQVSASASSIHHLIQALREAKVKVEGLVLEPLASSESVLTTDEREMGAILADIGGGTTDVAVFQQGSVWYSSAIPVAGYQLTNDLAIAIKAPYGEAEQIKVKYGAVDANSLNHQEEIEEITVRGFGSQGSHTVSRHFVCRILRDRCRELFLVLWRNLKEGGLNSAPTAGLILTGGSACLPGLEELAKEILNVPVRIGRSRGIWSSQNDLSSPTYATSIGILLWSMKYRGQRGVYRNGHYHNPLYQRMAGWVRDLISKQSSSLSKI